MSLERPTQSLTIPMEEMPRKSQKPTVSAAGDEIAICFILRFAPIVKDCGSWFRQARERRVCFNGYVE